MRFALPLAAVLLTTGCPNYQPYLPDGGRAQVNCNHSVLNVPVTVVDKMGAPVPEAVISVEYMSYAENENLIADARGVAVVKEKFGPGVVRVQGSANDMRTPIAEVTFVGTECSSTVSPRSLTLKLQ